MDVPQNDSGLHTIFMGQSFHHLMLKFEEMSSILLLCHSNQVYGTLDNLFCYIRGLAKRIIFHNSLSTEKVSVGGDLGSGDVDPFPFW